MFRITPRVLLLMFVVAPASVLAQPAPGDDLQSLAAQLRVAEAEFLALAAPEREPSARLTAVRLEYAAIPADLAHAYATRAAYERGELAAPPEKLPAIVAAFTTAIAALENLSSRLALELRALEMAEFEVPLEEAQARLSAARDALDTAIIRIEEATGPIEVSEVAIVEPSRSGDPVQHGLWRLGQDAPAELAVVSVLEQILVHAQGEIERIREEKLLIATRLYSAGSEWNFANALLIERGRNDAIRDIIINALTGTIDIALSWTSGGGWTILRAAYTVGDSLLTLRSEYLLRGEVAAKFTAIERDQIEERMKEALVQAIAADVVAGRALDIDRLLDQGPATPAASPALPTPSGTTEFLDFLSNDYISSGISAIISLAENEGREMFLQRQIPAESLVASLFLNPGREALFEHILSVPDQMGRHEFWARVALDEFKGLGVSLGLTAVPGAAGRLTELYRELMGGPTDEQLAERMVAAELEIFILSEAYRQLDRRYFNLLTAEPLLMAELNLARHRLLVAGTREFQSTGGNPLDPNNMVVLPQLTGPIEIRASVLSARVPWRVDVVLLTAAGEEAVVASAVGAPGQTSSASAVLDPALLPEGLDGGAAFEVRIVSMAPAVQGVDGDPATPSGIAPDALVWDGIDPAPDIYGFSVASICRPAFHPDAVRGPVVSTFEFDAEGWTIFGDAGPVPTFAPGELQATDLGQSTTWYWQAPARFLGDRRELFGTALSYRLRITEPTNEFQAPDVVLEGAGLTLTIEGKPPQTVWIPYRYPLDASAPWMLGDRLATDGEIAEVLSCLSALRIRGEFNTGPDTGWLSRVTLGGGP